MARSASCRRALPGTGDQVNATALDPSVVARAYKRSGAARWSLDPSDFERALAASVAHASIDRAEPLDAARHIAGLHLEDLALAAACAAGIDSAWDHFVREYRPALYRAADAIDSSGGARELADALYADLYGLTSQEGERRSLFRHFHARSRLATWLRAVLAQRHVDAIRGRRRLDPLPDEEAAGALRARQVATADESRFAALIQKVLAAALAALAPRDRLRVSMYYAQNLTLAEIGRLVGEHEATVSRQLSRTRRSLRASMADRLRDEHGLNESAIDECFRAAIHDPGSLDLAELVGPLATGKIGAPDRSS
jgi:RNA polymerase sigma-70 factor (ECF subfamily)